MAEQKAEKSNDFSAVYFRAKCEGLKTPNTEGTPQRTIHGHIAEFRINAGFIICAFDGAGAEETDETYPFKFHINSKDDSHHSKLQRAWAIVVDVCAREGISLVKVINVGVADRNEAKKVAEEKDKPLVPSKELTNEQKMTRKIREEEIAENSRKAEIFAREQRKKKITIYCNRTNWQDATLKKKQVLQMIVALQMIQNRLRAAMIQPDELPAFDGRLRLDDSSKDSAYISITYRSQASDREQHYIPHSSHIPGWDPFAPYYRLPHPIIADPKGQNPFHQFKDKDQEWFIYEMLEQLERNYQNVNDRLAILNMPDRKGQTPLHKAAENDLKNVYAALKRAGADENLIDKIYMTPLQILKESQERKALKLSSDQKKIKKQNKVEQKEKRKQEKRIGTSEKAMRGLPKNSGIQLASSDALTSLKDEEGNLRPVSKPPPRPRNVASTNLPQILPSKSSINPGQQMVSPAGKPLSLMPASRPSPIHQESPPSNTTVSSSQPHSPPQISRQQNKAAFFTSVKAQIAPLNVLTPKDSDTEIKEVKQPSAPAAPKK